MNQYRYSLQPYKGNSTRHRCPACKAPKSFTYYMDTETDDPVHWTVGRCNREIKCGYHYKPKQFFEANPGINRPGFFTRPVIAPVKPPSLIPVNYFNDSMNSYKQNNFVKFLINRFGADVATQAIQRYCIGTSHHWPGASVFWQIDACGNLRTGKIMLYNAHTGKRVRKPFNHITWMHRRVNMPDYELRQCFFGEHLLCDRQKPVAIVESEKTAIIASIYYPNRIWLASGSLSNLTRQKFEVLRGRYVTLFPDLKGFNKWLNKAYEFNDIAQISISDKLEYKACKADYENGLDLADYLLRFDCRLFKV